MADDRVALITGAGSGIGLATAQLLAGQGLTVVLAGRRAELLDQGAAAIAAAGGTAHAVPADLAHRDAPARLVADVLERTGRLDVIVSNAASYLLRPVAEFTAEAFDDHVAVNVRAPYFLVQAALPALRASPAAVVVNVSSAAAVMYRPGQTVYGLTKAALEHLTMNLASELAADGIRVVAVRPGPVATELHARAVADPEARLRAIAAMVPLGRLGTADEVALWIGHLVDARSAWVTGTIIAVDGGRILGSPGV
jgi:NAD(P)-dependent dehydrogenase (short-subunit alcohol dehydrogenase family)